MSQKLTDTAASVLQARAAAAALSKLLVADVRSLRRLLDPSRLQQTYPAWLAAMRALIGQYSQASASLSADFYDSERVAAQVSGSYTVPLLDPPPDDQIDESLRWATKDIWPRDPDDPATTVAQQLPLEARLDAAETKVEAVSQKLVTDTGRGTVRGAVNGDRTAVGYARAAALGACAFCKLMATRGMVYKTAGGAGRDANERFSGEDSVVKYHDNCHCQLIPVFKGQRFELSDHAAQWARLYQEYAAGHPGEQLNRFRQALADHGQTPVL